MENHGLRSRLARIVGRTLGRVGHTRRGARSPAATQTGETAYPGDFQGTPKISYAPNPGNGIVADPGEIVWTWVPYEEDHSQGKDRPVLVIGRDRRWLLALPLSSKDHDRDATAQAEAGRRWKDIGSGPWDNRGRASEVRVDRILRIDPARVRRQGAVLDQTRFDQVAAAVQRPAP